MLGIDLHGNLAPTPNLSLILTSESFFLNVGYQICVSKNLALSQKSRAFGRPGFQKGKIKVVLSGIL